MVLMHHLKEDCYAYFSKAITFGYLACPVIKYYYEKFCNCWNKSHICKHTLGISGLGNKKLSLTVRNNSKNIMKWSTFEKENPDQVHFEVHWGPFVIIDQMKNPWLSFNFQESRCVNAILKDVFGQKDLMTTTVETAGRYLSLDSLLAQPMKCRQHGLSQQGVWVSFWTNKPLNSTPQDTQIFLWGIS